MYETIRDEKIAHGGVDTGQGGWRARKCWETVLDECRVQGIVKNFRLQREISPGEIPDAVVEVVDGIFVVIDSKAPIPPYRLRSIIAERVPHLWVCRSLIFFTN